MKDEFYDKVYDAWKSGKNSDMVLEDRYDNLRIQGYYPDEISLNMFYSTSERRENDTKWYWNFNPLPCFAFGSP